jgi:hypothetical protein
MRTFLLFLFVTCASAAFAQPAPKLMTMLGQYKDSVQLNKEGVAEIIHLPLRIIDNKKVVYSIAAYQVAYKRIAYYEDEKTGKVVQTSSLASQRFTETPISSTWSKIIKEDVQPGEEILFFDIIVKDPKGKVMFAPDFKIKVF